MKQTPTQEAKNVLSLSHGEALDFFMKSEQFHGFELPEYFNFDKVLSFVREKVGDTPYEQCLGDSRPDDLPDVNLDILLNKDGQYGVRPLILANPFLYYFLARELCNPEGWETVLECFETYTVPHITSCALPVIPDKAESFHKAATVLNWWNRIEQRSLELSLHYRYMFITDITNCYGSIDPQTIPWALSRRGTKFETSGNENMAARLETYLRALQQGRNIGIPQGSALFDFVAEIILGYGDLLLHEALEKAKIKADYEILRYRDDYRIFCNDRDVLERISYILQSVLEGLNFRMNTQKTRLSDSVVLDSVKKEKLSYIYNTPISNKKGWDFDSFEKHLFFILMFGRQYPNSGQLKTLLSDLDKRIEKQLKPRKVKLPAGALFATRDLGTTPESPTAASFAKRDLGITHEFPTDASFALMAPGATPAVQKQGSILSGGSVRAMAAVATQIALDNVAIVHYPLRVISRLVDSLKDGKEKTSIIDDVYGRLCGQPNSDYSQLWLQNITYKRDRKRKKCPYTMRLCKLAAGDMGTPLWNNSWLRSDLTDDLPYGEVVDRDILGKAAPVIVFRESRLYDDLPY